MGDWKGPFALGPTAKYEPKSLRLQEKKKKKRSIKKSSRWSSTAPLLYVLVPYSCGTCGWLCAKQMQTSGKSPCWSLSWSMNIYGEVLYRGAWRHHSFIVWQILSQFQAHSQVLRKECLGLSNKVATGRHGPSIAWTGMSMDIIWKMNQFEDSTVLNRKSHCKCHWKVCWFPEI